ncbi:ATP-binding protein [Luteibacter sp. 3190]|uniref:sensor histidine kinase n=1 Tax=Luteibacter sp. 3190 TaxID=2817736 RepID=UPI002865367F|nr:ATP-binding protein [Luteibacter sp. 3190]MDR6936015.1 signal transduction histidine kinase/ligand-binding sensor domain-containing protein [Luteibacter sp. 3190]
MIFTARRAIRFLLCLAALCTGVPAAHATDPTRTLEQLHHTALRAQDGAPVGATSIAQTEDGWLWFATRIGLFRYDGFEFEKYPLLPPASNESEAMWALYAAPGGDLWVARAGGGLLRLRRDTVTSYGANEGLPDHVAVDEFATAGDGALWVASEAGIFRFDGSRWNDVSDWGLKGEFDQFLEAPDGVLWVVTDQGTFVLPKGARRFEDTGLPTPSPQVLLLDNDGSIWRRQESGVAPLPGDWGKPHPFARQRRANGNTSLLDRDGTLWTVACDRNLCRVPAGSVRQTGDLAENPKLQAMSEQLGMTSQGTMTMLEDRDGSIWVATKAGLDRFRDSWLATVRFPQMSLYFSVFEDAAGTVWTGTAALTAYDDRLWTLTPDPRPLPGFTGALTSVWTDPDGSTLMGGYGEMWRKKTGALPVSVPLPEGAAKRRSIVQAIARDGTGRLWLSLRLRGVFYQDGDGAWQSATPFGAPPDVAPWVIHIDPRGRPWFGYQDGSVSVFDGTRMRRYGEAEGLRLGPVSAVASVGDTLVVGSEHGMSFLDDDRFRMLTSLPRNRLDMVTGIVGTRDGAVWAYGVNGLIHFTHDAWKAALAKPETPVEAMVLTMEDGVPGPAQLVRPLPTVFAARNGYLWFSGSQGLAWLDTSKPLARPPPPPVIIRSIESGTTTIRPGEDVVLKRSRDLHVSYTALAPGRPRGVLFRYRLEGVDATYQDGTAHRDAHYMDLAPGDYRFVAEASYDGRHWSRSEPLAVHVPARLFEMRWFQLACLGLVGLLVWLAHRWRVRLLTRRLRMRLDERHRERERIARDLHDTLLQGVQGLILRFQAFVDGLSPEDRSRTTLERTIDRAEALLVEGRDRVKGLRTQASVHGSLEERIAAQSEDIGIPVHFEVIAPRMRRPVSEVATDELHSIVREALLNATQHSHAKSIWITIEYARRWLTVTVRDDGDGFDGSPSMMPGEGHYGIVGMRERAARLNGRLDVVSLPQRGVAVTAKVPARVAYARDRKKR